jgi:hypothetical protein
LQMLFELSGDGGHLLPVAEGIRGPEERSSAQIEAKRCVVVTHICHAVFLTGH